MAKTTKVKKTDSSQKTTIDAQYIKEKYLIKDKWLRGLNMLLFIVIKYVVSWLILLIAVLQFILDILLGKPNDKLINFTENLNFYYYQIVNFLTYNSEEKPFPFTSWPNRKN